MGVPLAGQYVRSYFAGVRRFYRCRRRLAMLNLDYFVAVRGEMFGAG